MNSEISDRAFPTLDEEDIGSLRPVGCEQDYTDGEIVIKVGASDIDFFVVESGQVDILNPADDNRLIVSHTPGQFIGDIDLLTQRPVLICAVARGATRVLRVPGSKLRHLLNAVPRLSDKLLVAFQVRRELLKKVGLLGIKVVGPAHCRDTTVVREFLYKNFVPFTYYDTGEERGKEMLVKLGHSKKTPAIQCNDGRILHAPSLRELSVCAGIWRDCPVEEYELAIVGAGPAGIAAAVYAASEGLRTIVLDRVGPGGQAGGSSKIENFIGFPAGLSGTELATRGVLQMLKFGANVIAPIDVEAIELAATPDTPHILKLDCGARLKAFVVLVAAGVTWRKLQAPGAERFERAGVYYACTSVESALYQGTEVAVVGAGNSAGQAAMFLAETCASRVHLIVRRDSLGDSMSEYLEHRIRETKKIEMHVFSEVAEVFGDRRVEAVELVSKKDGSRSRLKCSAVFVFIGAEPRADWLPPGIARDDLGYILTGADIAHTDRWPLKDRDPCPLETSLPRVLAAGDIRAGTTKRVGFAVGDGSLAVSCAHRLKTIRN